MANQRPVHVSYLASVRIFLSVLAAYLTKSNNSVAGVNLSLFYC